MPGYNVNSYAGGVDEKLFCSHCFLLLKDPVQTLCGHRYCFSCVQLLRQKEDPFICVIDNEKVAKVFPDQFVKREILATVVKCRNSEEGCPWKKEVRYYEEHEGSCLFHPSPCPNKGCDSVIKRSNFEEHVNNTCGFRRLTCSLCGTKDIPFADMETHHRTGCDGSLKQCPLCDDKVPEHKLQEHMQKLCRIETAQCPFKAIGCETAGPILASEIDTHNVKHLHKHMVLLYEEQCRIKRDHVAKETQLRAMMADMRIGSDDEARPSVRVASTINGADAAVSLDDFRVHGMLIDELQKGVISITTQIAQLQTSVNELRLGRPGSAGSDPGSIEEALPPPINGVLVMPIPNFGRRRQTAMRGEQQSIYSDPFYTSRYGYKARLRVYLDGDGLGRGTHLGVFFVLCKGKYDQLLRWPFRQRVTFTLFDLSNVKHISDSFSPNPESSSFHRPMRGMNVASGCPLFLPLEQLLSGGYVKDDTIYIKVVVDTAGLVNF